MSELVKEVKICTVCQVRYKIFSALPVPVEYVCGGCGKD